MSILVRRSADGTCTYTPEPDLQTFGLLDEYTATMDHLFDTYSALLGPLQAWLKDNFDEKESILEKKAFDTLRGLLPMSTLGQVAFRGNAQAFEYLINRSAKHPLGELRWFARGSEAGTRQGNSVAAACAWRMKSRRITSRI